MKLYQCRIGEVVCSIHTDGSITKIGHVVGLTKNNYEEIIPMVHWAGEKKPQPIHHRNIDTLEHGEVNAEKVKRLKGSIQ